MTARKPNTALLDATLAEVRKAARRKGSRDKPRWDQEQYRDRCGTAMCFAGWALALTGYKWALDVPAIQRIVDDGPYFLNEPTEYVVAKRGDVTQEECAGKRLASAHTAAARVLGISEVTADEMFRAENTLSDLTRMVRRIKTGELR